MLDNFWLHARHCEFYLIECWMFLYSYKCSLFLNVVKLFRSSLILLSLATKIIRQNWNSTWSRANYSPRQRQDPFYVLSQCLGIMKFFHGSNWKPPFGIPPPPIPWVIASHTCTDQYSSWNSLSGKLSPLSGILSLSVFFFFFLKINPFIFLVKYKNSNLLNQCSLSKCLAQVLVLTDSSCLGLPGLLTPFTHLWKSTWVSPAPTHLGLETLSGSKLGDLQGPLTLFPFSHRSLPLVVWYPGLGNCPSFSIWARSGSDPFILSV